MLRWFDHLSFVGCLLFESLSYLKNNRLSYFLYEENLGPCLLEQELLRLLMQYLGFYLLDWLILSDFLLDFEQNRLFRLSFLLVSSWGT